MKRYVLFVDEEQIKFMLGGLQSALDYALKVQNREMIVIISGLIAQLRNPKEVERKNRTWGQLVRDQVLGK
jgi:hypothetical protein